MKKHRFFVTLFFLFLKTLKILTPCTFLKLITQKFLKLQKITHRRPSKWPQSLPSDLHGFTLLFIFPPQIGFIHPKQLTKNQIQNQPKFSTYLAQQIKTQQKGQSTAFWSSSNLQQTNLDLKKIDFFSLIEINTLRLPHFLSFFVLRRTAKAIR